MQRLLRALALLLVFVPLAAAPLAAEEWQAGDLTLGKAWARFGPGAHGTGYGSGGAFFEVSNRGAADRLLAAESPVAERVELHGHEMADGVMRMRRIESLEVPAGATLGLAPGGQHVMLMGLKQAVPVGERFELTLVFEKAGRVEIEVPVRPLGATGP